MEILRYLWCVSSRDKMDISQHEGPLAAKLLNISMEGGRVVKDKLWKFKYFLSQKEDNFQEDNLKVMSMNLNSFRKNCLI